MKALRTTKKAKSTPEQHVILSDKLGEDKDDPSFVSSAIPSVCKKLRCRVDKCTSDDKKSKKGSFVSKRVTRAVTQTKATPKGKDKK